MYPVDHNFIFFGIFKFKKKLWAIFLKINTKLYCTPKGWLNTSTALSHMLMPSAQRWTDNRCCREIPTLTCRLTLLALKYPGFEGPRRWVFVISCVVLFTQFCVHGNIQYGTKTSLICFQWFRFLGPAVGRYRILLSLFCLSLCPI